MKPEMFNLCRKLLLKQWIEPTTFSTISSPESQLMSSALFTAFTTKHNVPEFASLEKLVLEK